MSIRGNIDRVSAEGLVFGWCLDDARLGVRLDVTIRADGVDIGTIEAAGQRQDLRDAGLGDGRHGFTFTLPVAVLRQRRASVISAFDATSGTGLGDSVVYRSDPTTTFDDRLTRIESDVALIRERLRVSSSGDAAIATLFEAVGGFFARLGQDLRDGRPSADGFGLAGQMDVLAATFADVALPIVAAPSIAVLLRATVGAAALRERLAEIANCRMVGRADVFLLDRGGDPQTALLPGIVRNLRYLREGIDEAASLTAMARALHHPTLIVLDGALTFDAGWLDGLVEHLAAHPGIGMVGIECFAVAQAGGPIGGAARDGAPAGVVAVDEAGFAVRAEALAMCEGFDSGFADLAGAVVDLCHRLRQASWEVDALPGPTGAALAAGDDTEPSRRRSIALLEQRWPMTMLPAADALMLAFAVDAETEGEALVAGVAAGRAAGYRVAVLTTMARAEAAALLPALLRAQVQTVWTESPEAAAAVVCRIEVAAVCGARLPGVGAPAVGWAGLRDWLEREAFAG